MCFPKTWLLISHYTQVSPQCVHEQWAIFLKMLRKSPLHPLVYKHLKLYTLWFESENRTKNPGKLCPKLRSIFGFFIRKITRKIQWEQTFTILSLINSMLNFFRVVSLWSSLAASDYNILEGIENREYNRKILCPF